MSKPSGPEWDLSHLRLVQKIVTEGSLTRVATLLGTPQPSISRKLTRFEQECGGKLFVRTGRGLQLSDFGKQVYPRMQLLLREAEHLTRDLQAQAAVPTGEVRLGALPSLTFSLVLPLLERVRREFPGIVLSLSEGSTGQLDQWLSAGAVDLIVTLRYGGRPSTDFELLQPSPAYLAGEAGRRLVRGETVPFKALDGAPLVLPAAPSATRLLLEQLARREGIALNVVAESDSTQLQGALAARGHAYAVLTRNALAGQSGVDSALIVEPEIERHLAMAYTPARPASRATREVSALVRELLKRAP